MDTLVENVLVWWLDTAEARAERKKEKGKRIVKRWWERYSLIGAVRRWDEMTKLQMGITPGGPNSKRPARPPIEMPMMKRSVETRRVETLRTKRHVPYSAEGNESGARGNQSVACASSGGVSSSSIWWDTREFVVVCESG